MKTNDSLLVIYLSSLIRSIIALHNLILNKLQYREAEKKADSGKDDEKKDEKKEEKKDEKEGEKGKVEADKKDSNKK